MKKEERKKKEKRKEAKTSYNLPWRCRMLLDFNTSTLLLPDFVQRYTAMEETIAHNLRPDLVITKLQRGMLRLARLASRLLSTSMLVPPCLYLGRIKARLESSGRLGS